MDHPDADQPAGQARAGELARRAGADQHGASHDIDGGAARRDAAGGIGAGRLVAGDEAAQQAGHQPQLQPAEEDELLLPEEHEAEELETALAAPEDAGVSYYFVRARKAGPRSDVYAAARVGDLERARYPTTIRDSEATSWLARCIAVQLGVALQWIGISSVALQGGNAGKKSPPGWY